MDAQGTDGEQIGLSEHAGEKRAAVERDRRRARQDFAEDAALPQAQPKLFGGEEIGAEPDVAVAAGADQQRRSVHFHVCQHPLLVGDDDDP